MNNNIFKLDNENVKLYITSNSNLPKLLKNSGSLVIYHNSTEDKLDDVNESGVNYLYVGGEMLASGWGLNTQQQKYQLIELLESYPDTINGIIEYIEKEIINRESNDDNLLNLLKNSVQKNTDIGSYGHQQNNLYFTSDSFNKSFYINNTLDKFYVRNLLSLFKSAEYKDIEINDITHSCSIGFFNGETFQEYEPIIDNKQHIYYVPYYSLLSKYTVSIDYKQNDTSGISNAYVTRYINNDDINNEYTQTYKHILKNDDIINILNNNESISKTNFNIIWNSSYSSLNFNDLSDSPYLIFEDKYKSYDLFKSFQVIVGKTPESKYKKFPLLEDFDLKSISNIIKEYPINIDTYTIKPLYLFFWNNVINDNIDENTFEIPESLNVNNVSNFKTFDNNKMIDKNEIEFDIDFKNQNSHFISFALPSKYAISNIKLVKHNKLYNITGLFKSINYAGISLNPYEYNESYVKVPYNIYYMFSNLDYLKGEYKVIISFTEINDNTNIVVSQNYITNLTSLNELFENYTSILDNDEFTGSHWTNAYSKFFIKWLTNNNENDYERFLTMYFNKVKELFV